MALASRSLHDRPNSDNSWDTAYPNGDKPSVVPASLGINSVAFAAAGIDLTNRPTSTAISVNYRQYLTGASASTATISVFAVSGTLGNWTIDSSGNNLTNLANAIASGSLQVRADDGAGTIVTFPVQNWSIVSATQLKHTPGWCMELDHGSGGGGLSGWLSQIAAIANEPNITSVCYRDYWAKFEDPAGGTYNVGFNVTDQLVAACAAAGKKFCLAFLVQLYNGAVNPGTAGGVLPNYFETLTCSDGQTPGYVKWTSGAAWAGGLNLQAMVWDSVVMNKFIAMTQAYAARYESNPTFVLYHGPGETSIGVPLGTRGYTIAALSAQYQHWVPAARAAFPTTMLRCEINWIGANSDCQALNDVCAANKVIPSGPDVRLSGVQENEIFNGSIGTKDWRGINGWVSEIQQGTSYNGLTATTAMQTLWNFAESGSPAQGGSMASGIYMILRNTWTGPAGQSYPTWTANILPFIRANPVPRTAYPSGW